MSTEFKREERYIVFKLSDVERYLTDADRSHLAMMKNEIDAGRDCANKPPFKGLIVESDWPEYEPTWKAIEARVIGAQPAPSEQDESVRKSWARFSNELHRSPDAPYPGMSEAFEQHFSQSFTDRDWRAESGTWAAAWKAAKHHDAQNVPDFADAYEGAMEEVAIWKKRALEAEDLNRKLITDINGPTHMGEPVQNVPSVPDEIERDVLRACCGTFHGSRHRITCERYKGKKAPEAKP